MKTNMRRISLRVTAQTLYNLERLRQMGELRDLGRVVDKLTREKMVALQGNHFRESTKMKNHTEKGAGRRDRNLARLTAYRKANGLGCLAKVAGLAGKPVTDELIRELITEGKKIPMEVWRQIGAALDALEQEDSHE